jgi:hypothetical protein
VAVPRFLFVTGTSGEGPTVPAWPDRYTTAAGKFGADGEWVAWRLVGPNNRELGRSAAIFPDYVRCLDGVHALVAVLDELHPLTALNQANGLWSWRLELEGTPVAVSGRGHQRRRECEYNLTRFLATAAVAVPADPRSRRR